MDTQKGSPEESFRFDNAANPENSPAFREPLEPWRPWAEPDTATAFDSQTYGTTKGYHSARSPSPLPVWAALIAKADRERLTTP